MLNIKDPTLSYVFTQLLELHSAEERLLEAEPIQYGIRLTLSFSGLHAGGTLYHSPKKRRLTFVPNGNGDPAMAQLLRQSVAPFISEKAAKSGTSAGIGKKEAGLERWLGSDEAGKGDLFGPLVVGGFYADKAIAKTLAEMGIRDSKELAKGGIKRLSGELLKRFPERCSVVEISPTRYNEMYGDFERQGGINGLLGWGHARIIRNLVEAGAQAQAAVVDRFGGEHRLTRNLPRKGMPELIVRPKAESNMAVAAGAILARARFDEALERMKEEIGFQPHAGSGAAALQDLKRLHREKEHDLYKYVKMHFSPVKALGLL